MKDHNQTSVPTFVKKYMKRKAKQYKKWAKAYERKKRELARLYPS